VCIEPIPDKNPLGVREVGKEHSPSRRWRNASLVLLAFLAILAAGVVWLALLVASQPSDEEGLQLPDEGSPEAGFARDMINHHAQAVQMAEIVRDKTKSEEIHTLATDITLTQQAQIGMMLGWLGVWGLPATGTQPAMSWMGHPTEGLMPGMATPEEIDSLYDFPPEEADKIFLRLMIPHHQAAIPMAEAVLQRTERPEIRQLAGAIEASQRVEIQMMEQMLRAQLGDSAEVTLKPQNGASATGSATFTKTQGGVSVELSLSGLPKPVTMYLAHIHPGTCAEGEQQKDAHHEEGDAHAEHEAVSEEELGWPLSQVQADAQGHGRSTTTLKDASMERIFTGELKHLNVHAAGSGNPPVLACAELYYSVLR
jgi:uncharacterized protein (DUF305 family)